MKHRILIKVPALLLVLAMLLSLCACAVNPKELLEQLDTESTVTVESAD